MDSRERDIHADLNLGFVMKAWRLSGIVACGKTQANYATNLGGCREVARAFLDPPVVSENPKLTRAQYSIKVGNLPIVIVLIPP